MPERLGAAARRVGLERRLEWCVGHEALDAGFVERVLELVVFQRARHIEDGQ